MLRHNSNVVQSLNNLKLTLKVLSLVEQRSLLVSLRVCLRSIHIAFAIHHLIPMPVDNRTTGNTNLEYVRIVCHKRDSHISAKAPTMNTKTVGIYIRQALKIFHTLHLVFHFFLTKLTECNLLESLSAVFATTVVEDKEQIALLSHVSLPTTAAIVPTSIHVVGMRTTIYIYNCRILLVRVEVYRLNHTPI